MNKPKASPQHWWAATKDFGGFLTMMSLGTALTLVALDYSTTTQIAAAQSAVHSVGAQTVQGNYDTGVYQVVLGSTQGVNISFLKSGEVIQRVWIDDPSQIVVDFDGCLAPSAEGGGAGGGCGAANGARFIHVRQLRSAIELPEEMSTGEGGYSLMTILTSSDKVYQIQLVLGSGRPPHSLVEIIPAPPPAPAQMVSLSQQYNQEILAQLSRGLAVAEAQGLIDTTSAAYGYVKDMIARMQSGTSFADAQTQSNTPNSLIARLRSLGSRNAQTTSPTPQPQLQPVAPVRPNP